MQRKCSQQLQRDMGRLLNNGCIVYTFNSPAGVTVQSPGIWAEHLLKGPVSLSGISLMSIMIPWDIKISEIQKNCRKGPLFKDRVLGPRKKNRSSCRQLWGWINERCLCSSIICLQISHPRGAKSPWDLLKFHQPKSNQLFTRQKQTSESWLLFWGTLAICGSPGLLSPLKTQRTSKIAPSFLLLASQYEEAI